MGSVKDLQVIQKQPKPSWALGRFRFPTVYKRFWLGEMPDHIEGKGAALCLMGAYCFEQLEKVGVKNPLLRVG